MKYRKKPVAIDAFRIGIDNIPDWAMDKVTEGIITLKSDCHPEAHIECRKDFPTWAEVKTLEGTMTASHGDYIIRGIKGECYPCKEDIFLATYDPVESVEEKVYKLYYE